MRAWRAIAAGLLSLCIAGCGVGDDAPASSVTSGSPDALAVHAARTFLDTYVTDGGRIQRTDQGGDTVSEGQAYGMLLAAAIGDSTRFGQIWTWTRQHLLRRDGLLAFHWAGGRIVDAQPASDADLDAARALLLAGCRFHRMDLRSAASRLGQAVLAHETAMAGGLHVLLAGPWANHGSSLVFNPSYVDPTTLEALAASTSDTRFRAVADSGRRLVDALTRPLPPDWATVSTSSGAPTPVSGAGSSSGPGLFSFDAPRTLIRFALDANSGGRAAVARAWDVFKATRSADIVSEHALNGAPTGTSHSPVTLVGVAGAAYAAGDAAAARTLLTEAQRLDAQHPTYYGSAWVALGRLMLTTQRLRPCAV